jgi:hypothetical protein
VAAIAAEGEKSKQLFLEIYLPSFSLVALPEQARPPNLSSPCSLDENQVSQEKNSISVFVMPMA